jgi:hypothetical protein
MLSVLSLWLQDADVDMHVIVSMQPKRSVDDASWSYGASKSLRIYHTPLSLLVRNGFNPPYVSFARLLANLFHEMFVFKTNFPPQYKRHEHFEPASPIVRSRRRRAAFQ